MLVTVTIPLRDSVKQLSVKVLKGLLTSEAMQLQLENEAYALLVAWLRHSPHAQGKRHAHSKELAPLLRYHHMTADFLANVMTTCPYMLESGLLPSSTHHMFCRPTNQRLTDLTKHTHPP